MWLNNRDFRRALALGINRDQINETFFLGIGVAGSVAPASSQGRLDSAHR
jgi:peptide/nickel transport system substrate-binding protein